MNTDVLSEQFMELQGALLRFLERIEKRFDRVDKRFDAIDITLAEHSEELEAIHANVDGLAEEVVQANKKLDALSDLPERVTKLEIKVFPHGKLSPKAT